MKLSLYERALAVLSPIAAEKRFKSRAKLDLLQRAYDGADKSRLSDGWLRAGGLSSADTEIEAAGRTLRDRSRHLVRNNPHAAKAISVLVNNIVGDGIIARANTGDENQDKVINELFEYFVEHCDPEGLTNFYGAQTLCVREMLEGGDVLVRRRPRRTSDGLRVPLQLQILEADYLDPLKTGEVPGGYQINGVEYDKVGRRKGYWLYDRHPGSNAFLTSLTSKLIPASDVAHMFEKQRTQARGVPWLAPVIMALSNLDDYELSESMRKKMEACLVAMVTSDDSDSIGAGITDETAQVVDASGRLIEKFAPGMIAYLKGGKDIKFNQPSASAGFSEYKRSSLHTISAGARVPYELLTNDLSQVNFSGGRIGLVDFRRMCTALQWQVVIPMFCRPVWQWFCEAAYLAGLLPTTEIPVMWSPPKFESVTPLEDAQADLIKIRTGTMTLAQAIENEGYDYKKQLDEIARTNVMLDKLEIALDSDPRNLTKNGQKQQAEPVDTVDANDTSNTDDQAA